MTSPRQTTLQRKWLLAVNTGTVGVPVWTTTYGVAEIKFTPGDPNLEDDDSYENAGYTNKTKTALSTRAEIKLLRKRAAGDQTSYDAGQEKLRSWGLTLGDNGVGHVRIYDRFGGPEAYEFFCEVAWSNAGGDMKVLEAIDVTLEGKGAPTSITNPVAVAPPVPVVLSLSPAAGSTAGGTLVTINGSFFTQLAGGAAAVQFGGTNAGSYVVVSDTQIIATAPAKAAGTYQVKVTNVTGASVDTALDNFTYS